VLEQWDGEGIKIDSRFGSFKGFLGVEPVISIFLSSGFAGRRRWGATGSCLDGGVVEAREGTVDVDNETVEN
jgi:hypothetical protein